MLRVLLVALCAIFGANAKLWNNPVLAGADFPDPGVIIVDGVYYAATTTNNGESEKYPIHSSTDLQNWKMEGYIFNSSNLPPWSTKNSEFWAPEIHKVGSNYIAYFTSRDLNGTKYLGVGIATSKNVLGPYTPQAKPLVTDPGSDCLDATLVRSNEGDLMLVWRSYLSLWARNLTDDGLSFKDNITKEIMTNDIPWEGDVVEGPWQVIRNGYYYIFYSGNNFCSDDYVVGVARSKASPIGPFEKKADPILVATDKFKGPGHGSIVPDTDGKGMVFIYHGWPANGVCGCCRYMFTSQVEWGDDDWPKNIVI